LPWCKDNITEADCIANGCYWINGRVPCQSCNDGVVCETTPIYFCAYLGCYWYDDSCHCDPSLSPENFTIPEECIDAGCYWYNGSCHSALPVCETIDYEGCENCPSCFGYDMPVVGGCYWYDGSCHTNFNPNPVADDTEMLFACQNVDTATYYCYYNMINHYIPYAQTKNLWTINQALTNNCNRSNVHSLTSQHAPKGIFEADHGNHHSIASQVTGEKVWATYDPMFYQSNAAGKIIYFLSCETGEYLGPWLVDTCGALAFAGFTENVHVNTSTAFRQCLGEFWVALCDGDTVGVAKQRTLDMYDYWIGITGSANLTYDREHFMVYGDMDETLYTHDVVTDTYGLHINCLPAE